MIINHIYTSNNAEHYELLKINEHNFNINLLNNNTYIKKHINIEESKYNISNNNNILLINNKKYDKQIKKNKFINNDLNYNINNINKEYNNSNLNDDDNNKTEGDINNKNVTEEISEIDKDFIINGFKMNLQI